MHVLSAGREVRKDETPVVHSYLSKSTLTWLGSPVRDSIKGECLIRYWRGATWLMCVTHKALHAVRLCDEPVAPSAFAITRLVWEMKFAKEDEVRFESVERGFAEKQWKELLFEQETEESDGIWRALRHTVMIDDEPTPILHVMGRAKSQDTREIEMWPTAGKATKVESMIPAEVQYRIVSGGMQADLVNDMTKNLDEVVHFGIDQQGQRLVLAPEPEEQLHKLPWFGITIIQQQSLPGADDDENDHVVDVSEAIERMRPKEGVSSVTISSGGNSVTLESDDLRRFRHAVEFAVANGAVSTASLQRHLSIGFQSAATILAELERLGVAGPKNGSRPREVLITVDQIESVVTRYAEGDDA